MMLLPTIPGKTINEYNAEKTISSVDVELSCCGASSVVLFMIILLLSSSGGLDFVQVFLKQLWWAKYHLRGNLKTLGVYHPIRENIMKCLEVICPSFLRIRTT